MAVVATFPQGRRPVALGFVQCAACAHSLPPAGRRQRSTPSRVGTFLGVTLPAPSVELASSGIRGRPRGECVASPAKRKNLPGTRLAGDTSVTAASRCQRAAAAVELSGVMMGLLGVHVEGADHPGLKASYLGQYRGEPSDLDQPSHVGLCEAQH